jgi:hypothetical protein
MGLPGSRRVAAEVPTTLSMKPGLVAAAATKDTIKFS